MIELFKEYINKIKYSLGIGENFTEYLRDNLKHLFSNIFTSIIQADHSIIMDFITLLDSDDLRKRLIIILITDMEQYNNSDQGYKNIAFCLQKLFIYLHLYSNEFVELF